MVGDKDRFIHKSSLELKKIITDLGFISCVYFVDIEPGAFATKRRGGVHGGYKKLHTLVFTDDSVKRYCEEYWSRHVKFDPYFPQSKKSDFYVWPYESGLTPQSKILTMMEKYSFRSKLTVSFPLNNNGLIKGCFALFFNDKEQMLRRKVTDNYFDIDCQLKKFHLEMIDVHAEQIFPYQDLGIISKKARLVLSLIAEGHTRNEISEMLYISERGVDYHIDRLKCIFECNNVTALIAKLVRLKVI